MEKKLPFKKDDIRFWGVNIALVAVTAVSASALWLSTVDRALPFLTMAFGLAGMVRHNLFLHASALRESSLVKDLETKEALLTDALSQAAASERESRAILSNLSHELRTPLNSVIGFAALLAEGEEDEERVKLAQAIQQGGWQLLALVNDLVRAGELAQGPSIQSLERFKLGELLSAVDARYRPQASAKGLAFTTEVEGGEGDAVLLGDFVAVERVLGVLVTNAIKYCEGGTIQIVAKVLNVTGIDERLTELIVKDQGPGMSKDAMDNLFHPFLAGEPTLTKKRDGIGIGLYTAKKLVENMRGEIRVESDSGHGTAVYVVVPFTKADDEGVGSP